MCIIGLNPHVTSLTPQKNPPPRSLQAGVKLYGLALPAALAQSQQAGGQSGVGKTRSEAKPRRQVAASRQDSEPSAVILRPAFHPSLLSQC